MELQYSDLKFYWNLHKKRMELLHQEPVSYTQFSKRLKKMNLHDAIYTPRKTEFKSWKTNTPIQDNLRRIQTLKDENVQILTFEEIDKVLTPKQKEKMARYNMKPKKSLWKRFISLFK